MTWWHLFAITDTEEASEEDLEALDSEEGMDNLASFLHFPFPSILPFLHHSSSSSSFWQENTSQTDSIQHFIHVSFSSLQVLVLHVIVSLCPATLVNSLITLLNWIAMSISNPLLTVDYCFLVNNTFLHQIVQRNSCVIPVSIMSYRLKGLPCNSWMLLGWFSSVSLSTCLSWILLNSNEGVILWFSLIFFVVVVVVTLLVWIIC